MANQAQDYIAGWKTAADWQAAKTKLVVGGDAATWRGVFEEFFRTRLDLRYLQPIKILQDHGTFSGEGFSIAAIQCSLVEFLESSVQGVKYRYVRVPMRPGRFEYSSSSGLFETFLTSREPFAREFNATIAQDFYSGVRCGLLHEARTKNGWRIHARDPGNRIIDSADKVLFRDGFQKALLTFVDTYGAALEHNVRYQEAFIRRFDDLCQ